MTATKTSLFDRWSATYDRPQLQNATYRPLHNAVLARLADATPATVLDLGCGTGQLTARLVERFPDANVCGLDYSMGMLREAQCRLGGRAALLRCDAQALPLASQSMDLVVCTESFHWYPDQESALAGIARVLRPGGQLLIGSIATLTQVGEAALRAVSSRAGQPIQALTTKQVSQLLRDAGFEVTDQRWVPRLGLVPWPLLTDARRGRG
jgi:ubiquinone/menaquinone biosynthesis C-methylase UbiE